MVSCARLPFSKKTQLQSWRSTCSDGSWVWVKTCQNPPVSGHSCHLVSRNPYRKEGWTMLKLFLWSSIFPVTLHFKRLGFWKMILHIDITINAPAISATLSHPFQPSFPHLPSGELTFCHGKIHHFIAGKIHYFYGPFSIAMLVITRG